MEEKFEKLMNKAILYKKVFGHIKWGARWTEDPENDIKNYISEQLEIAESLPNKDKEKEEIYKRLKKEIELKIYTQDYLNYIVSFVKESLTEIESQKCYVNPFDNNIINLPPTQKLEDHLRKNIVEPLIKEYLNTEKRLPELVDFETWVTEAKQILLAEKEKVAMEIEESNPESTSEVNFPPNMLVSSISNGNTPADKSAKDQSVNNQSAKDQSTNNQSVKDQSTKNQSVNNQNTKNQSAQNQSTLIQKFVPILSRSNKSFYIMQLRNYLRILRRFYNMTTIRKGLVKQVTYVTLSSNNLPSINHMFSRNWETSARQAIQNRLIKNMRVENLRYKPYKN